MWTTTMGTILMVENLRRHGLSLIIGVAHGKRMR
jgi:hypothetical protein